MIYPLVNKSFEKIESQYFPAAAEIGIGED
jgi:hypothetical protein